MKCGFQKRIDYSSLLRDEEDIENIYNCVFKKSWSQEEVAS